MANLRVVTLDGSENVIEATELQEFRNGLKGASLVAKDDGYDEARTVWNGSIDKHPAIIVQCSGVADVIESVNFARKHDLLTAVRGGSHNVAGNSVCEGGLVIDMGPMNSVRVDVGAHRVRAGGGATIGDVDRESQVFGLAVPLGIVSLTGIAGLTLCGGHSWLTRKHGFACDNLTSVDIVTADGRYLIASKTENADLFWALRGGGGNFGIVTSFEFEAHPIGPEVMFCAVFYPMEDAAEIFRGWRDFVTEMPDDFTTQIAFWSIPHHDAFPEELHGKEVIIPSGVHCGSITEGERFIQPLRELGEPLLDLSGPAPYVGIQQGFDPFFNIKGDRFNYWKSLYLNDLSDADIDRIVARGLNRPNPWTIMPIRHMGGAAARVASDATALGGRDAPYMLSIDTSWTDPADSDRAIEWTREFWDEMREKNDGAIYLNFVSEGEDTEAMMRASYGNDNYERLIDIKTKYDPANMFRLNQNILPRSSHMN
jgi:FAD/FMN-containing dehydrogenase